MSSTSSATPSTATSPNWYHNFALRAGVLLVSEIAAASFISALSLLIVVANRVYQRRKRRREGRSLPSDQPTQPVSLLFVLAMIMEVVQATSNIMSARWAFEGGITEGSYCNAQAAIKQIGDDGAALSTMFLAIMTVTPMVWPKLLYGNRGRRIVYAMMAFMVVFGLLLILLPSQVIPNFYGSTGPWCWIPSVLPNGQIDHLNGAMQIAAESGWFWITSATCFVCYGYVVIHWLREASHDPEMTRQALVMSWYPIAYFIEIFPQSLVRILILERQAMNKPPPHEGWIILTSSLFASSGWVNVALWALTGRQYGFSKDVYEEDWTYEDEDEDAADENGILGVRESGEGDGFEMKPMESNDTERTNHERHTHNAPPSQQSSSSHPTSRSPPPQSIILNSPTQYQSNFGGYPGPRSQWEDDPATALRLRRALSEVTAATTSSSNSSSGVSATGTGVWIVPGSNARSRSKRAAFTNGEMGNGSGRSRSLRESDQFQPIPVLAHPVRQSLRREDHARLGTTSGTQGEGDVSADGGGASSSRPPGDVHAGTYPHLFP